MKTIKIIDLLNLVYEKKAPKKILYKYCEYEFCVENNDYKNKNNLNLFQYLFSYEDEPLSFEVVIIEDKPKKIEKIKMNGNEFYCEYIEAWIKKSEKTAYGEYLSNKLNEAIDKLNYLLEKSDKDE